MFKATGTVRSATPENPTVLVVDDEEEILLALDRVIKARFPEAQVVLARDAESALQALAARPFWIVISDYRLRGGLDGAQLLQRVAKLQPWAALLAVAADPDPYLSTMSRREGFAVLTKPLDEALMLQMLRRHLAATAQVAVPGPVGN
jgi:DNA-binding NtrC family response regulator